MVRAAGDVYESQPLTWWTACGGPPLLDASAPVPCRLVHASFVATPLSAANADLDYAAYLASPEVIRLHSDGRWPIEGFTVDQDREQVALHEADHAAHHAFTFSLLDPAESESLGCLYVNPLLAYLRRVGADAETLSRFPQETGMVTFWIRQGRAATELTADVAEAVNRWLIEDWPLAAHLFRIRPVETASRAALERLPLRRVRLQLPQEERPYLWYRPT